MRGERDRARAGVDRRGTCRCRRSWRRSASSQRAFRRFSGVAHQRSPVGSSPHGPSDGVPAWTNRSGRTEAAAEARRPRPPCQPSGGARSGPRSISSPQPTQVIRSRHAAHRYAARRTVARARRARNDAGSGDATAPASDGWYDTPPRSDQSPARASDPRGSFRTAAPAVRRAWRCYRSSVPIPRRYTTDAIVLSRFDFGEADRILTLITPGGGKLKAIAKGIRRPTSPDRRQPRAVRRAERARSPAAGPSTS